MTISMGGFYSGYIYDGRPWTGDNCKHFNPVGMPYWFARGSLNRAIFAMEGPYTEPAGLYTLLADEALVFWEMKQGTPEWTPPAADLKPTIFSIHRIDRRFVSAGSLLYKVVDPDHIYAPGDLTAVWFSSAFPPAVVGAFRPLTGPGSPENRDNSGRLF
jgi:hypothetical protein